MERTLYNLHKHPRLVLTEVKGTGMQTGLEESSGTVCGLFVLDSIKGGDVMAPALHW